MTLIPSQKLMAAFAVATLFSITCKQAKAQTPSRGTLLQFDFNGANPWPGASADVMPSTPIDVATTIEAKAVGTIDKAKSTEASGGLLIKTEVGEVGLPWIATYTSGLLPVRNLETNLGKLTLSLDLSASSAHPVTVRLESFNTKKTRTGGLEATIYPPAPNFYQRSALDLSSMSANGVGKFNPVDPYIQLTFELKNPAWPDKESHEIRVDNVHYAVPAWYVSAGGSDTNDGRTERTAFATPQKAIDASGSGDIIAVMNGTYLPQGIQEGIARFKKPGSPAGWISLKNYPGHKPLLFGKGTWSAVRFWYNDAQAAADEAAGIVAPVPAYIEVRGLHIRAEGDVAKEKYPQLMGQPAPETNTNGISVSWRTQEIEPHHLRFADNLVEYCPGAGIGPGQADWVTIENNVIRNNCWTTIYGTSGISLNHGSNFNGVEGAYTQLIRNNVVSGNRTFLPWKQIGKVSDGNGIIVDVNQDSKLPVEQRFYGRTLIQNNVSFNNGGSGIHTFKSKRVDVINNTVYLNSASPELLWGQMFVQQSDDIRFFNNIVVAPNDQPVNTNGAKGGDQNSTNIYRANNLYFGGGSPPLMGEGDVVGDPQFVNASIDDKVADFRLKPGSPGTGTGRVEPILPATGIEGKLRGTKPDKGAYQR